MERTTKKTVRQIFQMFLDLMGKVETKWEPDKDGRLKVNPGSWELDNQPVYGGYCITQDGGASNPLGSIRMKPRQFVDAVRMAKAAAYLNRNKRPVYGVAYFYRSATAELFLFDDEDRADAKHKEIQEQLSPADCIARFTEYIV